MLCPHCGQPVFRKSASGDKLKARTSMLIFHKSGIIEMNCGSCGRGLILPLTLKDGPVELRKAVVVVRKT